MDRQQAEKEIQMLEPVVQEKWRDLLQLIDGYGRVGVAFSGGIDSGLLAAAAHLVLGEDMMAYTIESPVESPDDAKAARRLTPCSRKHLKY